MKNNPLVIISTFLPLNNEYKSLWNKINKLLKDKNIDFLLLTASDGYDDIEFPVMKIPFSLKDFNDIIKTEIFFDDFSNEEIQLVERDINWVNDSVQEFDKYLLGIKKCQLFYEILLQKLRPNLVFTWGYYLPQSVIFKQVVQNLDIPVYCLERGFYSNSLMVEDLVNAQINDTKYYSTKTGSSQVYDEIKKFYLENYVAKYQENLDQEIEDKLLVKKNEGFKLVSIFGSYDVILFPPDYKISKELSPIFKSTLDFVKHLKKVIDSKEIVFFVKPHPNEKIDYSFIEDENFIVSKNVINRKIFEISDVIIFGNSTLIFDAIFYEKPIVVYANTPLKFAECVYSINDSSDIKNVILSALSKVNFQEKVSNCKYAIGKILQSYIYFYNDLPNVKNLDDFIDFILNNLKEATSSFSFNYKAIEFDTAINFLFESKNLDTIFYFPYKSYSNEFIENCKKNYLEKIIDFYGMEKTVTNNNELLIKAEELILKENFDSAEKILLELLSNNDTKVDALNNLSYLEIQRGNINQALNYLFEALKISPNDEISNNNLNYIIENDLYDKQYIQQKIKEILFPELKITKISSLDEYKIYQKNTSQTSNERVKFENNLMNLEQKPFYYKGICVVCNSLSEFYVDYWNAYRTAAGLIPNWRERLVCNKCGLNNRMRLTYHLIKILFPNFDNLSVYTTEQTTALFQLLKKLNNNIIGSEYLEKEVEFGKLNSQGIRNEDFTQLSFNDESFDLIISLEVLEHIPNYSKALKESFRVLKKNGYFFFTVPFNRNEFKNLVRAKVNEDGSITHILPPEYHGDPLNRTEGCLCYYHFGWELLDELKNAGYKNSYAILTYSKEYGYLGGEQIFFIAEKG